MTDMRRYTRLPDPAKMQSKLLGAAIIAFAVVALGAYSFASGESGLAQPSAKPAAEVVRTTPDDGVPQMPPPVAPEKSARKG